MKPKTLHLRDCFLAFTKLFPRFKNKSGRLLPFVLFFLATGAYGQTETLKPIPQPPESVIG
jgi:hypothetical protein